MYHKRASDLYWELAPIARRCRQRPAHWVSGPDSEVYCNGGNDFCFSCARAIIRNARRRDHKRRCYYFLDGGWRTEHDTPPYCSGCGVKLDGCLTSHGVQSELDYFLESGVRPGNLDDAACILEMLTNLDWAEEPDEVERSEAACDVAEAFLWCCQ